MPTETVWLPSDQHSALTDRVESGEFKNLSQAIQQAVEQMESPEEDEDG